MRGLNHPASTKRPLVNFTLKWNDKSPYKSNKTEDDNYTPLHSPREANGFSSCSRSSPHFMEKEVSIYSVCSSPPLFLILSQTEYILHHTILFLTILFNIILPLYLRQPSYHSFSAFDASSQNNICISLHTYQHRMCLPTKIILLIISCSLTLRRLMSYIYMEHPFVMFLDHTQRRSTVARTPLDE